MTKVLYTLNAHCRHPTQHFAISQSKVPQNDLMSSLTTGHYTSPQNWFLYSCDMLNTLKISRSNTMLFFFHLLFTLQNNTAMVWVLSDKFCIPEYFFPPVKSVVCLPKAYF